MSAAIGRARLTSTYRLQLHAGFGFLDAEEAVPYLHRLGVSHLYLSPILQAAPGSMHGYDVIDHRRVSDDLGGVDGLERLAQVVHEHGMGIVVDVVPNHMGIPAPERLNEPFWRLLADGPTGEFADWFDVDWDLHSGRIGLPILDTSLEAAIEDGSVTLDRSGGAPTLAYGDHRLPLAGGTESLALDELVRAQHYLLADWRTKGEVLNYRRFFDVDTLIAVRVERPDVFDATHAVLLDLHGRGVVDGFRIDHPDGLADPEGYLRMLADATDDAWVVVEKILGPDERLPRSWPCAGTTGYDAITAIQAALQPETRQALDDRWQATGGDPSFAHVELESTREAVSMLLEPEVRWLARLVAESTVRDRSAPDQTTVVAAVRELLAHADVYRAYARLDEPLPEPARSALGSFGSRAAHARPDLADAIERLVALVGDTTSEDPSRRELVVRFQQVCGPARAKGVEDTAFYRWHRLVALNEVGGDPGAGTDVGVDRLHEWAHEQALSHPTGLVCLSTHDTKRSGDARARLLALAADIDHWDAWWAPVSAIAEAEGLDEQTAYLVFQTLVAGWTLSDDRLQAYLTKAVREAKQHTTWTEPSEEYERRVLRVAERVLTDESVVEAAEACLAATSDAVRGVTIAATVLHLMLPGVPDVFQGTEIVTRTLVDPDNRSAVDFALRDDLLGDVDEGGLGAIGADELDDEARLTREKLWVTSRLLRLRRDSREALDGAPYAPLPVEGSTVIAFRRGDVAVAVPRAAGPSAARRWPGSVELPPGRWTDVLSGTVIDGDDRVACDRLFATLPAFVGVRERP